MAGISRHQQRQAVSSLRRGDVCLVSFDPTVGFEIRKTRPAVIIQNDAGNEFSPLIIVAAITSKMAPVPFPVEVVVKPNRTNGLTQPSAIRLDQIRTIDRSRVVKHLGSLDAVSMRKVDEAIKISLGLIPL